MKSAYFDFIDISPALRNALRISSDLSPKEVRSKQLFIRSLPDKYRCSFKSKLTTDEIVTRLAEGSDWMSNYTDIGSNHFKARFSMFYWSRVRDAAMLNIEEAHAYFGVDKKVLEILRNNDCLGLEDFCYQNFKIHGFELTSNESNYLSIYKFCRDDHLDLTAKRSSIRTLSYLKSITSSQFGLDIPVVQKNAGDEDDRL